MEAQTTAEGAHRPARVSQASIMMDAQWIQQDVLYSNSHLFPSPKSYNRQVKLASPAFGYNG